MIGSSLGLRAVGDWVDLGDGRRLLGQAGLGYAMHRSSLSTSSIKLTPRAAVAGSVAIQIDRLPWAGPEVAVQWSRLPPCRDQLAVAR